MSKKSKDTRADTEKLGALDELQQLIEKADDMRDAADSDEQEPESPIEDDKDETPWEYLPPPSHEERLGPFLEQYCHECDIAWGWFESAKRKLLKGRIEEDESKHKHRDKRLLLGQEEMEELKRQISEHLDHLDNCPVNRLASQ